MAALNSDRAIYTFPCNCPKLFQEKFCHSPTFFVQFKCAQLSFMSIAMMKKAVT